jgi:hypothetical protein
MGSIQAAGGDTSEVSYDLHLFKKDAPALTRSACARRGRRGTRCGRERGSVEVVELVQEGARLEAVGLDRDGLAGGQDGLDAGPRRTADVCGQVRDRQAALAPELVARRLDDHGVREHEQAVARRRLLVLRDVDDDDAHELVDLRCGEADGAPEGPHGV